MSLYFLDFEPLHVRLAVKLMSGNQLAGGKYVSYTVTGTVRFRLIELPSKAGNVKGIPPRPIVSGLFFD